MKNTIKNIVLGLGVMGSLFTSQPLEAAAPVQEKEWTFLIFLNADNNLDRFGVGDVEEMQEIGSNSEFNLVVQFDRAKGKPCKRLFIEKGNAEVIEDMGECDMGSVDVLTDFVDWGVQNYPSKKLAVVLWNHGSGWNKKAGNTVFKGISYDDESGNHITTAQMGQASETIKNILGRKLDILAFDACLMQMVEVSHAVKDNAHIMLASEEVEPGEGWAYNDSMKPIAQNPAVSAEEAATIIVDTYDASYDGGSQGNRATTQSWVRLSKADALASAIDEFAIALKGNFIEETNDAVLQVQKFRYRSNIDLIHFLKLMEERVSANTIADAGVKANVLSTLAAAKTAANEFVGHNASHGYSTKNAFGTAVYFPRKGYSFSKKYNKLAWAQDTSWDEMLQGFYNASKTQESDL